MKKTFVIFMLALLSMGMILSGVKLTANAPSQSSINTAIQKGLAYLNRTQDPDGSWNESFGYGVANTAMAVLAFENNGHYGWNASDPYNTTVQNGLNWLFSQGENVSLSPTNCAGNPDVSGTGIGVGWYGDYESCYETPMVLMAIIASNAPKNTTPSTILGVPDPLGVRTYKALAQDIVDWIAWAQNSIPADGYYEGGWRYDPQYGSSDNSVSGWPVVGLLAAQLWGINVPSWVKTELAKWTNTDQDMTGNPNTNSLYGSFGYEGRDDILGGIPETAEGIVELTYCGYSNTYANITAAEGFLYSIWTSYSAYGWEVNIGSLYSMYGVMKAMRDTIPTPIKFIANYTGTANYEWFNGTGEYADALVGNQSADGSWINWMPWAESDNFATSLTTAMGVLILQGGTGGAVVVKYTLTVTVLDVVTLKPIVGATVGIAGPQTLSNTTVTGGLAEFYKIQAGTYTVNTSMSGYVTNTTSITLTSNTALTVKLGVKTLARLSVHIRPSIVIMDIMNVRQSQNFTSSVSGGISPYYYQWCLNATAVPGTNSAAWTFTPNHSGLYMVFLIVKCGSGGARSNVAWVIVNPAPSVSISPTSVVLDVGQSQLFTPIVSNGTSPYSYQWYLNGSAVSGATDATWTFASYPVGSYSVYLKATDSLGTVAVSNTATVTVKP